MKSRNAAVICASGIGDGLLMMIAAERLKDAGYETVIYTPAHASFAKLFPDHVFHAPVNIETFDAFELIIAQNDNSQSSWEILKNRPRTCRFIFPTWNLALKPWANPKDHVCKPGKPMAHEIAVACSKWLDLPVSSAVDVPNLDTSKYRSVKQRIVIHPTSKNKIKQWSKRQFQRLAHQLQQQGYIPVFIVSDDERSEWEDIGFDLPKLGDLRGVAEFIYEANYFIGNDSGLGHLASLLGIPTLTVADKAKKIKQWRPGWARGETVTPTLPIVNCKGLRLRRYWQPFVSTSKVKAAFSKLIEEDI